MTALSVIETEKGWDPNDSYVVQQRLVLLWELSAADAGSAAPDRTSAAFRKSLASF